MKSIWDTEELANHWSLSLEEIQLLKSKPNRNHLAIVSQLKFYQNSGRFPSSAKDISPTVVHYPANQIDTDAGDLDSYDWLSRTAFRHRREILDFIGIRRVSAADKVKFSTWLSQSVYPRGVDTKEAIELAFDWFRTRKIECPAERELDKLVRSAQYQFEGELFQRISNCLSPDCKKQLNQSLETVEGKAVFTDIKSDPGRVGLDSVLKETTKLAFIQTIKLPVQQLEKIHPKVLHRYQQRISTESAWDVKQHPESLRYALLAIFLYYRRREIIDALVDLLIQIVHKLSVGAERRLVKEFVGGFRQVHGKNALLFRIAEAALQNPDGRVRDVIYPVASEKTLQSLQNEQKSSGPSYQRRVHQIIRASYGNHYRRMLPEILKALQFRSNNSRHRPVLDTYGHDEADGNPGQRIDCPNGLATGDAITPEIAAIAPCDREADWMLVNSPPSSRQALKDKFGLHWAPGNGEPYAESEFQLAILDFDWNISDSLNLTSTTSWQETVSHYVTEFSLAAYNLVDGGGSLENETIAQEFRLASSYEGPFNFMVGAFFDQIELEQFTPVVFSYFDVQFGVPGIGLLPFYIHNVERDTTSLFGKLSFQATDTLVLTAGGRWAEEDFEIVREFVDEGTNERRQDSFDEFSPEITATYDLAEDKMIYAAYRSGFKSGGFDASSGAGVSTLAKYEPETADGFEIGFKGYFFDNTLSLNGAIYSFNYEDLQVSKFDPTTITLRIENAGEAEVEGVELETIWQPAELEGLQLSASVNYNRARYRDLILPCYTGQSIAQGCNVELDPVSGRFGGQDLDGEALNYAPEWSALAGVRYSVSIPNTSLGLEFYVDAQYSDSYFTNIAEPPGSKQDSYMEYNASLKLEDLDGRWEVSLIARNLGDEISIADGNTTVDSGNTAAFGSDPMTGTAEGALWDTLGHGSRGSQYWLRFKYNFFND